MRKRQVVIRRDASNSRRQGSNNSTRSSNNNNNNNHHNGVETVVRYGVCQKNHAASVGGYALDGCREFMPSGEEGTSGSFTCAACGCHRNFHKKEVEAHEVVSECSSPS